MQKIGMRTIKTLISIFICLMIFIILKSICYLCNADKDYAFLWYNPFFAAIATAYSIAPNRKKSIEQASNRCVASLIGGFVGILLVVSYEFILLKVFGEFGGHWPTIQDGIDKLFIPYLLVTIFSVLVVVIGVALKKQPAVFVGILTFLSITVNANATIAREIGEWGFGLNRILSTIVGVLVALGVNLFRMPRLVNNKDLLFAVGIDGALAHDSDRLKGYVNYELNHLHEQKINTTLFTTRTPQTFMPLLEDVEFSHPICCMSGAALYDSKRLKYIRWESIDSIAIEKLDAYLAKMNSHPFKNYIINDVLYTYNKKIDNAGAEFYMQSKINAPYSNLVIGENDSKENLVYYLIVEHDEKVHEMMDYINNELGSLLVAQEFDVFDKLDKLDGYKYIKVYSKKVLSLNILKDYCQEKKLRLVGMSTTSLSNHLLQGSEIRVSTYDSDCADVLRVKTFDEMVKRVSSIYHNKKYQWKEVDVSE